MFGRRKVAVLVAEFLGTGILTLLILSVQRSTIGVPFFVALAAGMTFALLSFMFASTSGAVFNPALTIAMWTARKISTVNALIYIVVQLLGGWAAYGLYTYFVNQTLQQVGGHFTGRILVAEAVGAGVLAMGYAAAVYQRFSPAVSASVSGLSYIIGIVASSSAAIGLLNPAAALGARAWVWGNGLAYALGPVIGAFVGFNLYGLLFAESEAVTEKTTAQTTVDTVTKSVTTETVTVKKPRAKAAARTTKSASATATRKTKSTARPTGNAVKAAKLASTKKKTTRKK